VNAADWAAAVIVALVTGAVAGTFFAAIARAGGRDMPPAPGDHPIPGEVPAPGLDEEEVQP
jgi:hypothetical protein